MVLESLECLESVGECCECCDLVLSQLFDCMINKEYMNFKFVWKMRNNNELNEIINELI